MFVCTILYLLFHSSLCLLKELTDFNLSERKYILLEMNFVLLKGCVVPNSFGVFFLPFANEKVAV